VAGQAGSGHSPQSLFTDLPAECFPFTIELLDPGTRAVLWSVRGIAEPGGVWIPPARDLGLNRYGVRLSFADGTAEESD
jgi:hypothetical protein